MALGVNPSRLAVLHAIVADPGITIPGLAERTGLNASTVRKQVLALAAAGVIESLEPTRRGHFSRWAPDNTMIVSRLAQIIDRIAPGTLLRPAGSPAPSSTSQTS